MYEITHITSLGKEYTVSDPDGNIIDTIQVIPFGEILSATLGPYTESIGSYSVYLEKCIAVLSGFDEIDKNAVLWYATSDDEVELADIIEYAVEHEYKTIILEHLDDLE